VSHRWVLDLVERVGAVAAGATVTVAVADTEAGSETDVDADAVAEWCRRTGNQLVELRGTLATVRRGRADPLAELAGLPAGQRPGTRLWLYTNFDCNLACDYCCARSSPHADRRALGLDRVRRLAAEAAGAGVTELLLTGGEPFLLPDIDELANACTAQLPTTLLTNGMLLRGRRLDALRRMDRARLAVQISLDSPTPELHDRHRGSGSWSRTLAGIRTAAEEGFRVRVAATLPVGLTSDVEPFHAFLDSLGIARADQIIRPLAHRGAADHGLTLTLESLVPEVTVTADGVYWHPVSADHDDHLVTTTLFPLASAIAEVRRLFAEHRARATAAAQWFPCA